MNIAAPNERPHPWNWTAWLIKLCADRGYRRKSQFEQVLNLAKYRIYIDSTCAMFLGEVLSNGGFYSVYEHACNLYPQYSDSICVIDADTGWSM